MGDRFHFRQWGQLMTVDITVIRGDRPIGAARILATTALRYAIPIVLPDHSGEIQIEPARLLRGPGLAASGTIVDIDGREAEVMAVELGEPTRSRSPFWVVIHIRGGDPIRGAVQVTVCATPFVSVADVIAAQQRDVLTMPDDLVIEELRAGGEPTD
jgi:hypothetical protein